MFNEKVSKDPDNADPVYFHVYNRGVDKRDIFLNKADYYRFLHDLYEFNDRHPTNVNNRRIVGSPTSNNSNKIKLVDIICYYLMPNHYHLLVSVSDPAALTSFMRKLGTGYTNYFNQKYKHSGHLFQGKYKKIVVESEPQLLQLSKYIHLNPLKSSKVKTGNLEQYKYSSYLDYVGIKNMPSIISSNFLSSMFENKERYKDFVEEKEDSQLLDVRHPTILN